MGLKAQIGIRESFISLRGSLPKGQFLPFSVKIKGFPSGGRNKTHYVCSMAKGLGLAR